MMAIQPESPLLGIAAPFESAGIALTDRSFDGKVQIEGDSAGDVIRESFGAVPSEIGHVVRVGNGTYIGRITPDRYLLTTSSAAATVAQPLSAAADGMFVTITEQTDGHGGILLNGERATLLLSTVCGLDFRSETFPLNHVQLSSVAKIRATIWHLEEGWLLHCGRSYTLYLWRTLVRAANNLNEHAPISQG